MRLPDCRSGEAGSIPVVSALERSSNMEWLILLILPLLALLGAYTTQRYKRQGPGYLMCVPPVVSFAVGWGWILFAKRTKMSLAVAQVAFDTTYILSYFLAFVLLGETVTIQQYVGVALAICGIILLST